VLPYRKKKNLDLSQEEENSDRAHHLQIEKVQQILSDVFRNKLMKKYNKVSDIVAGLVNYRIMKQHH